MEHDPAPLLHKHFPSKEGLYKLPFQAGSTYTCTAGNLQGEHQKYHTYAYDFQCPEKTPLYAIRSGIVTQIKEDSVTGGPSIQYVHQSNEIWIDHGDGTASRYSHLYPQGVFVEVGEFVVQGELLALSGNTGFSYGSHLHLEVKSSRTYETLLFSFMEVGEPVGGSACRSKNSPNISRKEKLFLVSTFEKARSLKEPFNLLWKTLKAVEADFAETPYLSWIQQEQKYLLEQGKQRMKREVQETPVEKRGELFKRLLKESKGSALFEEIQGYQNSLKE